jgi:hypothetical protein
MIDTGGCSPAEAAGQPAFESDPQVTEGFLIGGIIKVEPLDEDIQSGHKIRLDRYTMADGNVYEMVQTDPKNPRSDTAIADSTPWLVGRKGFNEKVNGRFNEEGYTTIFVSPKGEALAADLRTSAHNTNSIISHVLENSDLRPAVLGYGSSRAAAIALGLDNMEYADVIAPCFPRGIKVEELPGTISQAALEALELGRHLLRLGPVGVSRQRQTFSTSPSDWSQYLQVIPKLWNGDAGRLAWANQRTHTHITLLDQDGWSQREVWHAMVGDRPNTTLTTLKGRHMSIPAPHVLAGPFHRFDKLAEMRGIDGNFNDEMLEQVRQLQPPADTKTTALGNLSVGTLIKAGLNLARG